MNLNVVVKSEPKGFAKGRFQCAGNPEGLVLKQGKTELVLRPGSRAEYLGNNRFAVSLDAHRLEVTVAKFGSYQNRLASDLAGFLRGDRPFPDANAYALPWYFYLISALPIGIPVITLGGAIPAAIGFGLAGACFGIAQKEEWPVPVRILSSLGLVVVGYIVIGALLVATVANRH